MVGVIPGLGGSVVDWIAYGHTVQTARNKLEFGSGDLRGVIGPECSNNAKEGGGLIPTLLFGIPGPGSMAIFISAVALLGSGQIEVGPSMLRNNLDFTYAIVWLLAFANVVGTVMCIAASGGIARLTSIRFVLLAPFLFMIISFAAFQSNQDLLDLVALFGIGFLGIMMRRFDWSRPAFLIGFVLSNPAENYANQAVQIANSRFRKGFEEGLDYIFSPIVITVISVIVGVQHAKTILPEGEIRSGSKTAPMAFLLCVLGYMIAAYWNASLIPDHSATDRVFPAFVALFGIIGGLWLLVRMIISPEISLLFADRERQEAETNIHGLWPTLSLLGFILALAISLLAFVMMRAGKRFPQAALYAIAGIAFMCFLANLLNRDFPAGLLQHYVALPWPLT